MMLRRIYIFCLALSMISFIPNSHAQKGKSEVSVAFGEWSAYNLINGQPYNVSSGVGMLNYKYYATNKVTIGIGIGYENITSLGSYLSFVPEFTYAYYDNKHDRIRVRLYSGAAIGISVFNDYNQYNSFYSHHTDNSGPQFSGQATLFGMRIGRKVGGFAELGWGYKGLVNFGLSYRFKTEGKKKIDNN